MREPTIGKIKRVHPYSWLWEPLEADPAFVLRSMFGGKAAYLDGRLMLYFIAKDEQWRGLLVCTDHIHHPSLCAEFPDLAPHPVLPKWLYLPETADRFESAAAQLVTLARHRDARLGVPSQAKRKPRPRPNGRRSRGHCKVSTQRHPGA
ncbi:MAG: hypothetical protein PHQ04_10520 [Opitutaceae bacterium]|nr:hypothetical protein [Opitutaceae bacterium]